MKKIISSILIVASFLFFSGIMPMVANAAAFTVMKDTSTRLKISTTADHVFTFTLPTGVDFDSTTQTDTIRIDFPATFAPTGTWATADFAFNDGTARTINAATQGAATIDCTVAAGVNNVCVAVDTTNNIFTIKPSSTYTASATAAAVTFTILGTAANGVLTNPSSVAATVIDLAHCDETASCTTSFTSTNTGSIAYGIADDDQVTITATVTSSITFDLDTAADFTNGESVAPYSVALGTLSTSSVTRSDTSSVRMIVVEGDTNAAGGMVVTIKNANGTSGLVSTSVPGDTIPSASATMAAGTSNYGLCVATSGLTGFTRGGSYNAGTCALASGTNAAIALSSTAATILTSSAPVATGHAELVVNAAISTATVAHSDYTDTLTFVATATF